MIFQTRTPLVAAVVCALALLSAGRPLPAQEPVTLAPRYEADAKWLVHVATRFELDLTTEDFEGKRAVSSLMSSREEKYTREFVAVENNAPTKEIVTYILSREAVSRGGAATPEETRTELEDRAFEVAAKGDAETAACTNGTVSEATLRDLHLRERFAALLPARPVAVGDRWMPEPADVCRFLIDDFTIQPDVKEGSVTCELKEVTGEAGKRAARVSVSISLKGKPQAEKGGADYQLALSMSGDLVFDVDRGAPRSLSLTGKMEVKGTKAGAAGESLLKVQGTGNIKYEADYQ